MNKPYTKSILRLLALTIFAVGLQSCRGGADMASETETPVPSSDGVLAGPIDDAAGFTITDASSSVLGYIMHKGTGGGSDNFSEKCVINSDSASKDISCILEAKELDLYFSGAKLRYNVPSNMCNYFTYLPPYYYNFEAGPSPGLLIDNSGGTSSHTVGGITVAAGAVSKCDYDYSNTPGLPNCCEGKYTLYTFTPDSANPGTDILTPTPNQIWGGKIANCLGGPALKINGLMQNGFPFVEMVNVSGTGINGGYVVESPISLKLSTNVYAANYFNPADHVGGLPLATKAPNGLSVLYKGNPYHEFTCYDRAEEIKARIRVQVREWNMVSEFNYGASGDPDSGGAEPGFPPDLNNDMRDWKDIGEFYPNESPN